MSIQPKHNFGDYLKNPDNFQKHLNSFEKRIVEIEKTTFSRQGPHIIWMREKEDDTRLTFPDKTHFKTGIPTWSRSFNDYDEGIALLAGLPNASKSTILINLYLGALASNEDLVIIDYSLDDPLKKRYGQYVACLSGLPYQKIYSAGTMTDEELEIYNAARKQLLEYIKSGRLVIITAAEEIEVKSKEFFLCPTQAFDSMLATIESIRKLFPNTKNILGIDSWHDLDVGGNEYGKIESLINELKTASKSFSTNILVSAHTRKGDVKSKGAIRTDDIKGSGALNYASVWTGLVRNEYKETNSIDAPIFEWQGEYHPVVRIEVPKSKVSSWDNVPLFYGLVSNRCLLVPFERDQYMRFYNRWRGVE
jgi:hypothetical protein